MSLINSRRLMLDMGLASRAAGYGHSHGVDLTSLDCRDGCGPHSERSASRSAGDRVVTGNLGEGGVRSKNGCGQVRPRTRHPSTMPIARTISHGLSRVEPPGALPTAYLP